MSVFNAAPFLEKAMDSLLVQSERRWELIVIDDASTDGSGDLLRTYAAKDKRVFLLVNEKNLGLTASLNRGLSRVRGEFVARQDADDESLPERFQRQSEYLASHTNCGVVGCGFEIIDVDGSSLSVTIPPNEPRALSRAMNKRNVLAHGSLMMRADRLKACGGYDEKYRSAQDYDLVMRLSRDSNIAVIPEVLYRLRLVPSSISMVGLRQQSALAERARRGDFSNEELRQSPSVAAPVTTGEDRYHYLKALHLIKSNRPSRAREVIRHWGHGSIPVRGWPLFILSFVPSWVRSAALVVKRRLDFL